MNIGEFIQDKLSGFGVELTTTGLDGLLIESGLTKEIEYTTSQVVPVKKVLRALIPELLLRPSVSEGDYSIKYDAEGIKSYYAILCADLGLPNLLKSQSKKIIDISDQW